MNNCSGNPHGKGMKDDIPAFALYHGQGDLVIY